LANQDAFEKERAETDGSACPGTLTLKVSRVSKVIRVISVISVIRDAHPVACENVGSVREQWRHPVEGVWKSVFWKCWESVGRVVRAVAIIRKVFPIRKCVLLEKVFSIKSVETTHALHFGLRGGAEGPR
jgi:hypothetical protein